MFISELGLCFVYMCVCCFSQVLGTSLHKLQKMNRELPFYLSETTLKMSIHWLFFHEHFLFCEYLFTLLLFFLLLVLSSTGSQPSSQVKNQHFQDFFHSFQYTYVCVYIYHINVHQDFRDQYTCTHTYIYIIYIYQYLGSSSHHS